MLESVLALNTTHVYTEFIGVLRQVSMGILRSNISVHTISIQQIDALFPSIQNLLNIDMPLLGLARDLLVLVNRVHGTALRELFVA